MLAAKFAAAYDSLPAIQAAGLAAGQAPALAAAGTSPDACGRNVRGAPQHPAT